MQLHYVLTYVTIVPYHFEIPKAAGPVVRWFIIAYTVYVNLSYETISYKYFGRA